MLRHSLGTANSAFHGCPSPYLRYSTVNQKWCQPQIGATSLGDLLTSLNTSAADVLVFTISLMLHAVK